MCAKDRYNNCLYKYRLTIATRSYWYTHSNFSYLKLQSSFKFLYIIFDCVFPLLLYFCLVRLSPFISWRSIHFLSFFIFLVLISNIIRVVFVCILTFHFIPYSTHHLYNIYEKKTYNFVLYFRRNFFMLKHYNFVGKLYDVGLSWLSRYRRDTIIFFLFIL